MSLTIITRPERNIAGTAFISRWACSRLPYIFEFSRRDIPIFGINNNGGRAQILIASTYGSLASNIIAGGKVFLNSFGDAYKVVTDVLSVDSTSPYYAITLNTPYTTFAVAGFVNDLSLINYRIDINIVLVQNGKTYRIPTSVTPSKFGVALFDVQSYLNGAMTKSDTFDYGQINFNDKNVWNSFNIEYRGAWKNNAPTFTVDSTIYYSVDAVKEFLDKYGQNLAKYVPFVDGSTVIPARFLTEFKRPTYFIGYPFDIGFIWPKELEGVAMYLKEDQHSTLFPTESDYLESTETDLETGQGVGVNRIVPTGSYNALAKTMLFSIFAGGTAGIFYYDEGYIAPGYFEDTAPSEGTINRITEELEVKLVRPCESDKNVYLKWRNSLGTWSYWLFTLDKFDEYDGKTLGTYSVEPNDLETGNVRDEVLQMQTVSRITIGANLLREDYEGVKFIRRSPKIFMYMLNEDGDVVWLSVRIKDGTFRTRRGASKVAIEFTIELPEQYNVKN